MKVVCELIKINTPTKQGRIYSKEILEKAIEKYNKNTFKYGFIYDNENRSQINFVSEVAFKCKDVYLNDDEKIECEIETLSTPKGKILDEIIEEKIEFEIFPIAYGNMNEKNEIVNLTFQRFDIKPKE